MALSTPMRPEWTVPYAPLLRQQSPDLPDVLIHMTGRFGQPTPGLDQNIATQPTAEARLASLLFSGQVYYSRLFDDDAVRAASFTQTTRTALARLGRYSSCGIAFDKQAVWCDGGGPALYVRGDEWDGLIGAGLPAHLRAKVVRLWPGWTGVDDRPVLLPRGVYGQSEWMHEREWRLPQKDGDWGWLFPRPSVRFLILENINTLPIIMDHIRTWGGDPSWVADIPLVTPAYSTGQRTYVGAESDWP